MAKDSRKLAAALAWLARRPALMLLTARDRRLAAEAPERFRHAWMGLLGTSLVWGGVMVTLWGLAWEVFGGVEPLVLPAMVATGAICLGLYRRALVAAARVLGGTEPASQAVAAATLVLAVGFSLLGLGPYFHRWGDLRLPQWLGWLLPHAKHSRVLLLMPLWGAWAMLIAGKFCRPTERTDARVAAFVRGCGALAAAVCMAVLMFVTTVYFQHLGMGSQVLILAVTAVAVVALGVGLCRRAGGPTRQSLLAANVLAQLAFVLAYLAGRYLASR